MRSPWPPSVSCGLLLLVARGALGTVPDQLARRVVRHHATLVAATYDDAREAAQRLTTAVTRLASHPTSATLAAARQAWLAARIPYLQSEAFRFCGGPIDALEPRINAWPIDESYIDGVAGAPTAGIINDPRHHPALTPDTLAALNEKEGETNISTGFHAIEFLLWGQDHSERGPGDRPVGDFVGQAHQAPRRRQYLLAATQLLQRDLAAVAEEWADKPGNFRAQFVKEPPAQALAAIIKALGGLTGPELSGERLTVAYETKDQEDEHSCFSDNTQADIVQSVQGIANVYEGQYRRSDGRLLAGPGLRVVVTAADAVLGERLGQQIAASLQRAQAIPVPFDQSIRGDDNQPGRQAVAAAITALQRQADSLAQAAVVVSRALGEKVPGP